MSQPLNFCWIQLIFWLVEFVFVSLFSLGECSFFLNIKLSKKWSEGFLNYSYSEYPPENRTEQNGWLGLTASLLAGGTARFPQLLPGPGQSDKKQRPDSSYCFRCHIPITGWRASSSFLVQINCTVQCRGPSPDYQVNKSLWGCHDNRAPISGMPEIRPFV